jgi:hypothetical protein
VKQNNATPKGQRDGGLMAANCFEVKRKRGFADGYYDTF